ncbi:MAG: DMT family transporter [Coriobacteriales bacterium]|nr:DMT family transporter [Coriobacteriales bacterium]
MQLLVSGVICLICAFIFEHPTPQAIFAAIIPILYAGICSDGIAYTLQIIGQQTTDPTVASIIMSLESVFAALGGWIILSESLSAIELLGCGLVFTAVILAQVPDFIDSAKQKKLEN